MLKSVGIFLVADAHRSEDRQLADLKIEIRHGRERPLTSLGGVRLIGDV